MKQSKKLKNREIRRILLIDPRGFGTGLNLGLGYIAAVLIENGYMTRVIDLNNEPERLAEGPKIRIGFSRPEGWEKKIDKGLKFHPDVIGISINSFTLQNAIKVIEYCRKKQKRKILYIAGGPHITVYKNQFLEEFHHLFDFAIFGESEETIVDLLKNIQKPQKVKGILYFDSKKYQVIKTEDRPPITNLDQLPFPAFECFDTISPSRGLYNYQLISSRGCPYNCVFCCKIWPKKWRARSPENIIKEIKLAQRKFKAKTFTFWDDNFTLDLGRAKKICDLFISENLKLDYGLAGIRADLVDDELMKKLKESGCTSVCMGIEDADPKTFPFVKKGEKLEDITKTVALIKKYNIPLLVYMITGLINHNYRSFLRSLKFIEKLGVQAHWNIAFPFPNTALYEWATKNGRFLMTLEDGYKSSMTSKDPPVVFDTKDYSKAERLRAHYLGNLRSQSYDMILSSRNGNFLQQTFEILTAILKYDRKKTLWHFSNLFKIFLKWRR